MPSLEALNLLKTGKDATQDITTSSRRYFLKLSAVGAGVALASPAALAATLPSSRTERILSLYSPNTGEMLRTVYWTPTDGYLEESLQALSYLMRDRRNDQFKRMDPKLIDTLYVLQLQLEPRQPIHVLSGYRSPETNAMLRQRSRNVARNSMHLHAKAIDIRMPDCNFDEVPRAAVSLQVGGVGRYSRSRFVHIDTGPVRQWGA